MRPEDAISHLVVQLGWTEVGIAVLLLAVAQFLIGLWIKARLEGSIKHSYDKKLEEFRYDLRVREQAAKVAEYMELARHLREDSPQDEYRKANKLAWELAMWLPADVYKRMAESLVRPNEVNNPLVVVVAVRKILLGDKAGDLTMDNIISHEPGIGKKRDASQQRANL
jgi:hypothetical protein